MIHKKKAPTNLAGALEFWISGFSRPIIGRIVAITIIDDLEEKDSRLQITIDNGSNEVTIDAENISALGRLDLLDEAA